jgi:uncharacterized membrane protein
MATAVLTTRSTAVYRAMLSPLAMTEVGFPGLPVDYTLQLTNTGNLTTELNLGLTGLPPGWTATIKPASLSLAPGVGTSIQTSLSIPASATPVTDYLSMMVSANGTGSPAIAQSTLKATVVIPRKYYLPLSSMLRATN